MSNYSIPLVSIHPGKIVQYNFWTGVRSRRVVSDAQIQALSENKPLAEVSIKASRRIKNAIDWLITLSEPKKVYSAKLGKSFSFRVCFVTLTLSSKQVHSDQSIKKELLNHFLVIARRKWGVVNYVWRAEAQQNGNVHFHLVLDRFIHFRELRSVWNSVQNKLGYVDRFRDHGNSEDPNSTDIHSVKSIKNLGAYLFSYMAKKCENRVIDGKLWGLSNGLSSMRPYITEVDEKERAGLSVLLDKFKKGFRQFDHASVIYVNWWEWCSDIANSLRNQFYDYVKEQRSRFKMGQYAFEL